MTYRRHVIVFLSGIKLKDCFVLSLGIPKKTYWSFTAGSLSFIETAQSIHTPKFARKRPYININAFFMGVDHRIAIRYQFPAIRLRQLRSKYPDLLWRTSALSFLILTIYAWYDEVISGGFI
ncbi:MAG: hypothetical protein ACK5P5_11265 [Pseudobdellovibrionaceae bacterium]